jgi:hypothetical protein
MHDNKSFPKGNWIPEILYEDSPDGLTGQFPFIPVPSNEIMPNMIFIFESRESGEFEPGSDGSEMAIVDLDLHQYINIKFIQKILGDDAISSIRNELKLPSRN